MSEEKPSARTLAQWLAHCESLHPQGARGIELGLSRVRVVAQTLNLQFHCPVITVAGTNGKGSTCAMMERILLEAGYRTGVYASPHLVHFEERGRIRGDVVEAAVLTPHFAAVEAARGDLTLTYFEFTSLAFLHLLSLSDLDAVILEVGLGGRLDAVNIVDADCAVITNIDLDHTDLLGDNREQIGYEKAGIMRASKPVIVSDPVPPATLAAYAEAIGADVWQVGRDFHFNGDKQQWAWRVHPSRANKAYAGLAYPALRGANQLLNASAALAAITVLRDRLPVTAQAVRNGLALVALPGRFQTLAGQPVVVLDVAHNPHAASVLAQNLDAMGYYPKTHAVFGAMADKDITAILSYLSPVVTDWYFCDLPTPRAASASAIAQSYLTTALDRATMVHSAYSVYPNVLMACKAALAQAASTDRIVVLGSFYTVGAALENAVFDSPRGH